eukprot:6559101-Alexandrium_andersonii.AAC.1
MRGPAPSARGKLWKRRSGTPPAHTSYGPGFQRPPCACALPGKSQGPETRPRARECGPAACIQQALAESPGAEDAAEARAHGQSS